MIERTIKQRILPAHSITIDELASVCKAISERFEVDPEEIDTTIVLAGKGKGIGFEGTEDLLKHKGEIPNNLRHYGVEIEAVHPKYGRQHVEIEPPTASNPALLLATITIQGASVGRCADILATAQEAYGQHKLKLGWMYHPRVFLSFAGLLALFAGKLSASVDEWNVRALALLVPVVGFGALLIWLNWVGSFRAKFAQIRADEKRPSNTLQYLTIMTVVLQFITAVLYLSQQLATI